MTAQVIPFPSHRVGLRPYDQIAQVTCAENGRALMIHPYPRTDREIAVFAHNDLVSDLTVGDWVRVSYTDCGPLVIERLARPGERPLPRAEYSNGSVYLDPDDPAWRLYE